MKLSKKDMKGISALVGGPDLSKLQKKIADLTARLPEAEAKSKRRELKKRKKMSRSPFPHTMEAMVGTNDWVQDPDKWTQARKLALKDRGADHPAYWSLVTHHYKQAGGRIRAIDAQVGGFEEKKEDLLLQTNTYRNLALHAGHKIEVRQSGQFMVVHCNTCGVELIAEPKIKSKLKGTDAQVGSTLPLPVDFLATQLRKGIEVENEHRNTLEVLVEKARQNMDPVIIVENALKDIALDHMNEIPDYYDRLEKMEREARS